MTYNYVLLYLTETHNDIKQLADSKDVLNHALSAQRYLDDAERAFNEVVTGEHEGFATKEQEDRCRRLLRGIRMVRDYIVYRCEEYADQCVNDDGTDAHPASAIAPIPDGATVVVIG